MFLWCEIELLYLILFYKVQECTSHVKYNQFLKLPTNNNVDQGIDEAYFGFHNASKAKCGYFVDIRYLQLIKTKEQLVIIWSNLCEFD